MKRVEEKAKGLHLHPNHIVITFLVALPLSFRQRVSLLSFFLSFDASPTAIFLLQLNRVCPKKWGSEINQQAL
jgi:hypothetical protein